VPDTAAKLTAIELRPISETPRVRESQLAVSFRGYVLLGAFIGCAAFWAGVWWVVAHH